MSTSPAGIGRLARVCLPACAMLFLTLSVVGCDSVRAARLMHLATELGAHGRWSEAVHYYERLWVQFPESEYVDDAKLQAARIYAGPEGKPRSAEDIYRDLVLRSDSDETSVQALLELADLYVEKESDAEKAIEILEAYLQRFPGHAERPRAGLKLARLYLQQGRYFQAIQEAQRFTEAVDRRQRSEALLLAAQAQELSGHLEPALTTYGEAREVADTGTDNWIAAVEGRIRILEEAGMWQQALDELAQLRRRHPNPDAVERWLVAIQERHAEMGR